MVVSESTKQYLAEICDRSIDYFNALEFAKDYVFNNKDLSKEHIVDCMLMSILWTASVRGESLTEEDVCTYLNIDVDVECGDISVSIIPEMEGWTLEEVLDYVSSSCGTM